MSANYYPEPAEAQSIKSLLHVVRILAIIFGVLIILAGIGYLAAVLYYASLCSSLAFDAYCGIGLGSLLLWPIVLVIFGVVDFVIYVQMREIETMVANRQYEPAKAKTFLWMILGFILGGVIVGILLLLAYLKFDPLINASRQAAMGGSPPGAMPPPPGMPPVYGTPPPAPTPPAAPAPMPPPQASPAGGPAPFCTKCGRPTTYIAQYGRYYCYTDQQYV